MSFSVVAPSEPTPCTTFRSHLNTYLLTWLTLSSARIQQPVYELELSGFDIHCKRICFDVSLISDFLNMLAPQKLVFLYSLHCINPIFYTDNTIDMPRVLFVFHLIIVMVVDDVRHSHCMQQLVNGIRAGLWQFGCIQTCLQRDTSSIRLPRCPPVRHQFACGVLVGVEWDD